MQDGLAQAVLASESGRLFADRARLVAPSFAITDRNALAVAQVCQRLDGIPLAIELAAARLNMLSAAQIAARLDHRFRLLIGGRRTAVRRQQTLEATVDWSYDLLSGPERALVRRLSVFAGGWPLEAAEAVAGDADSGGQDVLDLLGHLVTKSMVLVEEPSDEAEVVRYRFLQTIRQYAEQKLIDAGEADHGRTRHRDWYLNLAEQAVDGMVGANQKAWWQCLEREHDNLRAALAWSAADPDGTPQLLRLAGSLGAFWQARGYAREGIAWLELALARNGGPPTAARARALNWRGQLEIINGNAAAGRRFLERSIADARAVGDNRVLSVALRYLGFATGRSEERATARRLFEEAVAVSRAGGWQREIAWNLSLLGRTLALAGELEAAEELLQEGLAIGRLSGDSTAVVVAMEHLGLVYGRRGEFARARQILREAAALGQAVDVKYLAAGAHLMLGDLGMAEQDWDAAERDYRAALEAARLGATRGLMAPVGRRFAGLSQARGDHHRAVRLLSAFASITDPWDSAIYFDAVASEHEILATARKALGDNEFAGAAAAGKSLTLEQAVADALR
jgi:non-specific serine/threonine protein kinase